MAQNTHVHVGKYPATLWLNQPTRFTSATCAPGSTEYFQSAIWIEKSYSADATIAAKQWEPGDVIVAGISYDSGPGTLGLSYPSEEVINVSPDPNSVYWLAPKHTSHWFLSPDPDYFVGAYKIDVPLTFPNGNVSFSIWGGYIPSNLPITSSSIVWQDHLQRTFNVLSSAKRYPSLEVTNVRFVPNPTSVGSTSLFKCDVKASVPAEYNPVVFMGTDLDHINGTLNEPSASSIRHLPGSVWYNNGGGGLGCHYYDYPLPPPYGCNGQDTWTEIYGYYINGRNETKDDEVYCCLHCFYMPGFSE